VTDVILESIRSVVLLAAALFLWKSGRNRIELCRRGWRLILGGFLLLLGGSLIDVTDNFESLNFLVIAGDTPAQAFLEKIVGFLGGFVLLAVGLVRWLPTVTSVEESKRMAVEVGELNDRLAVANEDLRREIAEREQIRRELSERVNDVEAFNRLYVGRELRMVELKKEVNALLGELGRRAKYCTEFGDAKKAATAAGTGRDPAVV